MNMIFAKGRALIPVALLLSGCVSTQISSNNELEKENYRKAILDAAVIESFEIKSLPVIDENQVMVVTWTEYTDSYKEGKETTLKWGDVWVTLDDDVKTRCQQFQKANLVGDIQKLLGLPLDNTAKRSFVTLKVDSSSLFRPCASPSIHAEKCTADFPENTPQEHAAWYAYQTAQSYQVETGYPWTRLGYTYNWTSGENEVGPAEFVIKKGSKAVTISITDTSLYCTK